MYLVLISLYRSDRIEPILSLSLFPTDYPVKDKVQKWIRIFSGFDKVEIKALEKILEQKQRYRKLLDLILPSLLLSLLFMVFFWVFLLHILITKTRIPDNIVSLRKYAGYSRICRDTFPLNSCLR